MDHVHVLIKITISSTFNIIPHQVSPSLITMDSCFVGIFGLRRAFTLDCFALRALRIPTELNDAVSTQPQKWLSVKSLRIKLLTPSDVTYWTGAYLTEVSYEIQEAALTAFSLNVCPIYYLFIQLLTLWGERDTDKQGWTSPLAYLPSARFTNPQERWWKWKHRFSDKLKMCCSQRFSCDYQLQEGKIIAVYQGKGRGMWLLRQTVPQKS